MQHTLDFWERISELRARRQALLKPIKRAYLPVECSRLWERTKPFESNTFKSIFSEVRSIFGCYDRLPVVRLENECTIVVLGREGAGKTMSLLYIESMYWDAINDSRVGKCTQYLPIYCDLRKLGVSKHQGRDIREVALSSLGFSLAEIEGDLMEWHTLKPIWILDGFDAMGSLDELGPLLRSCGYSIVSCCLDYVETHLERDFPKYFDPGLRSIPKTPDAAHFHMLYLHGLTELQMNFLLRKTLLEESHAHLVSILPHPLRCVQAINTIPSIADLAQNPYWFQIIVHQLPSLAAAYPAIEEVLCMDQDKIKETVKYFWPTSGTTNVDLLGAYFEEYFNRPFATCVKVAAPRKFGLQFVRECQAFCQRLAKRLYARHKHTVVADASDPHFADLFQPELWEVDGSTFKQILLFAPIEEVEENAWAFTNKSLIQYFVACSNLLKCEAPYANTSETKDSEAEGKVDGPELEALIQGLGVKLFTHDPRMIRLHAELLATRPRTRSGYVQIVLSSRDKRSGVDADQLLVRAASNAISVLCYGSVHGLFAFSFSEVRDWSGIRVPNASLIGAQFIGCNLDGADLSHACMDGAILSGSTLKGTDLRGVAMQQGLIATDGTVPSINELSGLQSGNRSRALVPASRSLSFSPDGQRLAHFSEKSGAHSINVWSLVTGRNELRTRSDGLMTLAKDIHFSPDGKLLAFGTGDMICLLDATTGETLATLSDHTESINALAISPDSATLASSSMDSTIRLWSLSDFKCRKVLSALDGVLPDVEIPNISFSPNGELLAALCRSTCVRIWSTQTWQVVLTLPCTSHHVMAFTPDSQIIATSRSDNAVYLWCTKTGECLAKFYTHQDNIADIQFSPDGALLATCSRDGAACLWHVATGVCVGTFPWHSGQVRCLQFTPDGKHIASLDDRGDIRLWPVGMKPLCELLARNFELHEMLCSSPDGTSIIGYTEPDVWLHWYETKLPGRRAHLKLIDSHLTQPRKVKNLGFNSSGDVMAHFVEGSWRGLWNLTTGEKPISANFKPLESYGSCLNAHGDTLGQVWLVDTTTRAAVITRASKIIHVSLDQEIGSVSLNPDGSILAASTAYDVHIWNVETNVPVTSMTFDSHINHLLFSPDGRLLAAFWEGGAVEIWRSDDWTSIARFTVKPKIASICFSEDGALLAVLSDTALITIWDTAENKLYMSFEACDQIAKGITFNPVDRTLAVSCRRGVAIWSVDQEVQEAKWDLTTSSSQGIRPRLKGYLGRPVIADFWTEVDLTGAVLDTDSFLSRIADVKHKGVASR